MGSLIILDLVAEFVISKLTDTDNATALFSCAPGELTDMTLIADDMGADGAKVVGMHMF